MKAAKFILAAILAATSFASMAADVSQPMPTVQVTAPTESVGSGEAYMGYTGFVSTKTRAQVQQELRDARQRGEIFDGEAYPGPLVATTSKTRAEVVAELASYRLTRAATTDDGALLF